jgi:O-methyltransferase
MVQHWGAESMKFLQPLVKRILLSDYEELHRPAGTPIWFDNFKNLAQAYEQRLNEASQPEYAISPNETRWQLLARLLGTPPSEAYFIVQALIQSQGIAGDVCEFGVAQGETSALIANEMAQQNDTAKVLHLFDSFAGLPKPSAQDQLKDDIFSLGSMESYTGKMSCMEEFVMARLQAISFPTQRYVLHKGFFDEIVERDRQLPEVVCFAYVDFDFYEPIQQVLEFLEPRTKPGAVIIVDDYDFFSTGPKLAVDEFIQQHSPPRYDCFVPPKPYGHFAVLTKK